MQSDVPVPFNTALRHVEDYIALEQIRFGDTVHFVTDIEEDFFALPPLVLQPLVENAIKYGLNPKPGGGTITLRTRIEGDDVCVSVHDDGMGFDPSLPVRDGSVGLQNVRFRLKHVMNGSLSIDSAPGEGTTATIRIPLEEATKCM
jgi:sensor histidine kinase YesM